ncbi:hypothetical protein BMT55_08745 [Listeria newyorkensis]|uniref:Uncharacterized protein n=1 Tax=Listeria newyorkensis TaxID=1497681 RepID=A0ABX4XP95_9LIST|nr:hypothetical protein EP58_09320 [Listeria newyorkensis]PNP92326.1 hypothetical protein BMT55_08745 [Listeria newyorkensis]
MTFAEATKFPRGWLLKPDSETPEHDAEQGRQSHSIPLHIEVLKKQTTLFKNHNKAGFGDAGA